MRDFKQNSYPPASGKYKVFIKGVSCWQDHSVARLQISVGQTNAEGEKFFALTEWASLRFDKIQLIVSDTLQKHNIALKNEIDLETAEKMALFEGEKWLQQNKKAIEIIPAHKRIVTRWNDWIKHEDYTPIKEKLAKLFTNNEAFRNIVELKAYEFCIRTNQDKTVAFETSLKYIMEELPAFGVMLKNERAVDIYPGEWFREVFKVIAENSNDEELMYYQDVSSLETGYKRNKIFKELKTA